MVSFPSVQASNSRVSSTLPAHLVAVFVGATSGIGEYSVKAFAKDARQPRIYIIGRSEESADRIKVECKALNAEGEYHFIKADTSLIQNVDDVCWQIQNKEKAINLLFQTQGTLLFGTSMPQSPNKPFCWPSLIANCIETSEDLHYALAVAYYGRNRFILNLLPQLQQAKDLRRVVTVYTATKEGPIDATDFQGWSIPIYKARGHAGSMTTLSLEALSKKAPTISFIHSFPGMVDTNLIRGGEGTIVAALGVVTKLLRPFRDNTTTKQCGERGVFLSTSAKFPPAAGEDVASGVPLESGTEVARGTDGQIGSGVYSIDEYGESAGPKVEELLVGLRKEGLVEKVWKDSEEQFVRITGHKEES